MKTFWKVALASGLCLAALAIGSGGEVMAAKAVKKSAKIPAIKPVIVAIPSYETLRPAMAAPVSNARKTVEAKSATTAKAVSKKPVVASKTVTSKKGSPVVASKVAGKTGTASKGTLAKAAPMSKSKTLTAKKPVVKAKAPVASKKTA